MQAGPRADRRPAPGPLFSMRRWQCWATSILACTPTSPSSPTSRMTPRGAYQLGQWLPVLELLRRAASGRESWRATADSAVVLAGAARRCRSSLAASLQELTALYDEPRTRRSSSTATTRCSTSSRCSTAGCCTSTSTTARATSRAWRATTPRPTTGSSSPARPPCSVTRPGCSSSTPTVWCGSADRSWTCTRRPLLAPSARRTVLYAPTWEGDADYNDYTSVDTIGGDIVRAILAVPGRADGLQAAPEGDHQPDRRRSGTAHQAILALVGEAARRDPEAGTRRSPTATSWR